MIIIFSLLNTYVENIINIYIMVTAKCTAEFSTDQGKEQQMRFQSFHWAINHAKFFSS